MIALAVLIVALCAIAAVCFGTLNRKVTQPLDETPSTGLRSVTIYARATFGREEGEAGPWHEIRHEYDAIPTGPDMAGVFTWLCRDRGFTIMAADLACDALFEAIVEQETAGLDAELAGLRGVA